MNYTGFDADRFRAFRDMRREEGHDGPIQMLNLVKLRGAAVYEDGRDATGVTGFDAYKAYSTESAPVFKRLGGRIVWSGKMELMLIGPAEEAWDLCFIAEYPSAAAFVEMIGDPVYRVAMQHRQAAVETSRLIRMAPGKTGHGFG